MSKGLTRRRFGQLALLGTATAVFSASVDKVFARTSLVIYGVGAKYGDSTDTVDSEDHLVLESLDITLGQTVDKTTAFVSRNDRKILKLSSRERLTDLSLLSDGTFVLSSASTMAEEDKPKCNTLRFMGKSTKKLIVSGLASNQTIESFESINENSFLALVSQRNSDSPFKLGKIDRNTGSISFLDFPLPAKQRFATLAKCPEGKFYTTSVSPTGDTTLVHLDIQQGQLSNMAQLSFEDEAWDSGLQSLACSPSGQLFALCAYRYDDVNSLYVVEPRTGAMTLLKEFDVSTIAFVLT